MLMSDKYRRSWSDAAHHARRLTWAYDICSAIRSLFVDDVTNVRLWSDARRLIRAFSFCRHEPGFPRWQHIKFQCYLGPGSESFRELLTLCHFDTKCFTPKWHNIQLQIMNNSLIWFVKTLKIISSYWQFQRSLALQHISHRNTNTP